MSQMPNQSDQRETHDRFIQAIAIFKFFKAILFVLAALGAFGLMQQGLAERARDWASAVTFTSGQRLVGRAIIFITGLSRQRIGALGLVALFYAALFTTEGIGLWKEKRWAEYLIVVATSALIPLEIWESVRHPTPIRFAMFVINVAVVVYLIGRLRRPRGDHAAQAAAGATVARAVAASPEPERSTAG